MMEWSRENCLHLIDEYEKHPVLWNPNHGLYYNKAKKHDAWANIAENMGCSKGEAKKKMDSMLASFRREKGKGKKSVRTGKGRHKMYGSKWFAFTRMAFLLDKDEPKDTLDSMEAPFEQKPECVLAEYEDEEDAVANTQTFHNNEIDPKAHQPAVASTRNSPQKCKRRKLSESTDDLKVKEPLDCLKSASPSNLLNADESGVYGQHVAHKLRSYAKKTRDIVQHHINVILFRADMGKYNNIDS